MHTAPLKDRGFFYHSYILILQSQSGIIQAQRLGRAFCVGHMPHWSPTETDLHAAFCLFLGPPCFSDLWVSPPHRSGTLISHPCQSLKVGAMLYVYRHMEQKQRLQEIADTKQSLCRETATHMWPKWTSAPTPCLLLTLPLLSELTWSFLRNRGPFPSLLTLLCHLVI